MSRPSTYANSFYIAYGRRKKKVPTLKNNKTKTGSERAMNGTDRSVRIPVLF